MARPGSGKRRGKKAAVNKKRKVAVSRKTRPPKRGTADNMPSRIANMPFQDTSNLDVANEIASRHRGQIAATAAQPVISPDFPGNIPSLQISASLDEAAGSAAGAGAAAGVGASIAAAVGSAAGIGAAVAEGAEADDVLDATVTVGLAAYEKMLTRVAELEATVAQLQPLLPSTPGIGHNNPPPLDNAELEEIKGDIALLKAQPPLSPVEANSIASKFVRIAGRVVMWVGKRLDTLITETMKSTGKTLGATIGLSPIWLTFTDQLTNSATAIMQWLMRLLGQ
jgi:hypothetical protein